MATDERKSTAMYYSMAELISTFTTWLALNIALNYYNKWVLSETNFRFPFLLTTVNKTVGLFIAVSLLMLRKGLPKPQELAGQFKRPLVHVQGVFTALNIGSNNWSLMLITLTLNQVLKATVPLPTALLSVLMEGKSYSWQLCAPCAPGSLSPHPRHLHTGPRAPSPHNPHDVHSTIHSA
jgi:drug/metabolite transporter (DMT)-like permease